MALVPDEARLAGAVALSLLTALAATPLAMTVAARTDFTDRPTGYKAHQQPTPYLGGAAVVSAFLLASLAVGEELERLLPIVLLACGLWVLGTVDDRVSLSPVPRLVLEATAGIVLWSSGLGWDVFGSPVADLALTTVWVVGLMNAFNFMDNMDGAAATVGAVTALATGILALTVGETGIAVLCGGLCGACLGFLPYNLSGPARIFLGDGGSLPIGFVIAASLMTLPGGHAGGTLFLAAILLAGLPVIDTALVLISRRRSRVPLLTGGRDHMTHRLFTRLGSARNVAVALGGVQALFGAVAIAVVHMGRGSIVTAWSVWFLAAMGAIVLLETTAWAPSRPPPSERPSATPPAAGPPRAGAVAVEGLLIAFVTIACGLSPFLYGFYELSVWGPIALLLLAALLGLVVARPASPRPAALFALAGLAFLWLWSLLSTGWAESADAAQIEANRWILYVALLGIFVLLLRDDRVTKVLIGAATAAIVGLAVYVVAVVLVGDGPGLFLTGRLNDPLGYANGEAGYLVIGFWPLVALAEQARRPVVAAGAVSLATLLAGLGVLTQTRAIVPAVVVTGVVVIAAIPGRRKRLWALFFIAAGVAAVLAPLIDVYKSTPAIGGQLPDAGVLRHAMVLLLVSAIVAGVAWGVAVHAASRAPGRIPLARLRAASTVALVLLGTVAAAGVVVASGNPVVKVKDEAHAFVRLDPADRRGGLNNRFTSGAGNRFDYWRISAHQFRDHPLNGVGAGNYDTTYFLERRTQENVRQPHSIVMQTLGELGIVGALGLALFVIAVLAGFRSRIRRARTDAASKFVAVAAGGMFLTWLIHTGIDWLHEIPGVTAMALAGAAALVGPWDPGRRALRGGRRSAVIAVVGIAVLIGAVEVGRVTLADHYRSQAEDRVAGSPRAALKKADESLSLDDEAVPAYRVQAAAYARLNDYPRARAALLEATRREPHDFVNWALLGDLAVRRRDLAAARASYRRASSLNPRDSALRDLSRHPLAAG